MSAPPPLCMDAELQWDAAILTVMVEGHADADADERGKPLPLTAFLSLEAHVGDPSACATSCALPFLLRNVNPFWAARQLLLLLWGLGWNGKGPKRRLQT